MSNKNLFEEGVEFRRIDHYSEQSAKRQLGPCTLPAFAPAPEKNGRRDHDTPSIEI